ncbi:dTDP-4-dehydrorhamnose 3,5-epimerase family protein [Variovorax sp. J31P179]|uniref:dTDP-4-dehydrorhamnose 3,5-epimerase family protein n=1 Tax=Variovorax sp. J31P179 TaxID=3053508 RepID=UPI0025790463|nr:dTDP-4-dehydrorhamnose 3,5-epimerase family protein [Variovorax sp. J31P179]MDM0081982.1 dTDP-4-dehydrorhamnose 3,5-epimerase family protein [Variovorax sp. J31P179]
MSRFTVTSTALDGLVCIQRQRRGDTRGWFSRLFCADELAAAGFRQPVSQINHTQTRRSGSVRGLHFQHPPHAEDKLVSCIRGEVFDVAVDLRKESRTFLQWHAEVLSGDNMRSLLIPKGFAHGFQALSDDVELIYLHSEPYAPGAEGGLNSLDPMLAIAWPLPLADLSDRDAAHPYLTTDFGGI